MISKDSFVKIMNSLRGYWDELDKDMDRLNVVFDDNYLTRVFNHTMDALCDDLESDLDIDDDIGPWCYYFAFELDWGRAEKAGNYVFVDDEGYLLKTAEQLYDLLMVLNGKENNNEES